MTTARTDDEGPLYGSTESGVPEGLLALRWEDYSREDAVMIRIRLAEREAAVRLPTERKSATLDDLFWAMEAA